MDKKDLVQFLNDLFIPLYFRKKGNNWVFDNTELVKVINLQKSNFSNSYYINYGFIIKGLQLTTTTHVENRLYGNNITNLLNLESEMVNNERFSELKKIISDKIINNIESINTSQDLKENLNKRPHLNDIPIVVHQYFNLEM
jgi:hypothetical protein